MSEGLKLALNALKKEHKRLLKIAESEKNEVDEILQSGTESLKIYKELLEIIKAKEASKESLAKRERLKARSDRIEKINRRDLIKLMDKQYRSEEKCRCLATEISKIEITLEQYQRRKTASE